MAKSSSAEVRYCQNLGCLYNCCPIPFHVSTDIISSVLWLKAFFFFFYTKSAFRYRKDCSKNMLAVRYLVFSIWLLTYLLPSIQNLQRIFSFFFITVSATFICCKMKGSDRKDTDELSALKVP